ncbi:LysR family transcriptional regulator [Nitratireductor mangrovi]|uniref:LysR family transcriptional regulator n=1 Tax=Nitratireductor mangrovi TaxID=2599600 RepID=A0A5B8KXZ5_9HYPH|nr:LysR family transcriptional regulator [Nitratireductor mangrovi]QDZ00429.1 LysR family transcriptional regulator [Nitratireductor mangrovi]
MDEPVQTGTTSPRRDELIRKGFKIAHLRLICALRETGQMSAAAAQLAISQPAASRLAADLERIVGVPLHLRHARGVELTPYGERLAARAEMMLQGLDDTARELSELERGNQGTVAIGSVTGPAIDLVLPVVRHARVTRPLISVTLVVDTSDRLAEDLMAARVDFYIGRLLGDFDPKSFSLTEIGPEPVSLIVRTGHPLLRQPIITLRDCVAYDWVQQARGGLLRRSMESQLLARGIPLPEKVLSTSSLLLTLAYISQTNAIAPVASAAADFYRREEGLGGRIVALPVDDRIEVEPYALITHAGRPLSPASQVLFDMVRGQIEAQRERARDG